MPKPPCLLQQEVWLTEDTTESLLAYSFLLGQTSYLSRKQVFSFSMSMSPLHAYLTVNLWAVSLCPAPAHPWMHSKQIKFNPQTSIRSKYKWLSVVPLGILKYTLVSRLSAWASFSSSHPAFLPKLLQLMGFPSPSFSFLYNPAFSALLALSLLILLFPPFARPLGPLLLLPTLLLSWPKSTGHFCVLLSLPTLDSRCLWLYSSPYLQWLIEMSPDNSFSSLLSGWSSLHRLRWASWKLFFHTYWVNSCRGSSNEKVSLLLNIIMLAVLWVSWYSIHNCVDQLLYVSLAIVFI